MLNKIILIVFIAVLSGLQAEERAFIAENADSVNPLLIGQLVPDKIIWTGQGKPIKISSLVKLKPTILVFYRGGWCPYCNHQLNELQKIEADLQRLGYQLVAVSPETPDTIKKMTEERTLNYQLLSDFRLEVAKAFGVAFKVEPEISSLIELRYKAKLQRFAGEEKDNLPVPAVFVIDTDGVIQFSYVNPNYQVRLQPELLLKAAEVALKDENVRYKK